MTLRARFRRAGAAIGVWLYRRTDGRSENGRRLPSVLMLTTRGRRSGEPRSTCVGFLDVPEGRVVWGTGSGAATDPHWARNLRAAGETEVQLMGERYPARARELIGAEREKVWREVIVARIPKVSRYAARAGRTIPVFILTPA
jgi:deazaflavin-dependent oxidoreductase (nitroreductase family)